MTVQKYLESVKVLDDRLKNTEERFEFLKAKASSAGAIQYDKERVQSSIAGSSLENAVIECIELEAKIRQMTSKFLTRRRLVIRLIEQNCSGKDRDVLLQKYVDYMSFNKLARKYDVSRRTMINWNNAAIRRLTKKVGDDWFR